VQLIVDALDGPAALREVAASARPSWGLQVFSGAQIFADEHLGRAFAVAVARIREAIDSPPA
jgi:hypothetical protein